MVCPIPLCVPGSGVLSNNRLKCRIKHTAFLISPSLFIPEERREKWWRENSKNEFTPFWSSLLTVIFARVFRVRQLAMAWICQSSMRPGTWCQTCWWTHLCHHKLSLPCAASPASWGPSQARAAPGSTPSRHSRGSTPAMRLKTRQRGARGKPSRFPDSHFFHILCLVYWVFLAPHHILCPLTCDFSCTRLVVIWLLCNIIP